jgi:cytohesin
MSYKDIHEAVKEGTVEDVRYFVEKEGVDVNEMNYVGNTPLKQACSARNYKVVTYLLSKGANANLVLPGEFNPLMIASFHGNYDAVKELVANGANVNATNADRETALHMACSPNDSGTLEIVQFLVSSGAYINAKDKKKITPLHCVAKGDHTEILEYLIAQGADVNAKTAGFLGLFGRTPLQYAGKNAEIKRILRKAMNKE